MIRSKLTGGMHYISMCVFDKARVWRTVATMTDNVSVNNKLSLKDPRPTAFATAGVWGSALANSVKGNAPEARASYQLDTPTVTQAVGSTEKNTVSCTAAKLEAGLQDPSSNDPPMKQPQEWDARGPGRHE